MQSLKPATLVQQEEDNDGDEDDEDDEGSESECSSSSASFKAFNIPRFRYIDDEDDKDDDEEEEDDVSSNRDRSSSLCSGCSTEDDYPSDSSCSAVSNRYVVVSGTPHKILEHLLSDLRLDEHQGAMEGKEAGEWAFDFSSDTGDSFHKISLKGLESFTIQMFKLPHALIMYKPEIYSAA